MKNIPKIKFINLTLDELINNVLSWSTFDVNGPNYLYRSTFYMYPSIKNNIDLLYEVKDNYDLLCKKMKDIIKEDYDSYKNSYKNLNYLYQELWNKYNDDFMIACSKYFDIEWPLDSLNIIAKIGPVPVCPRFIQDRSFILGRDDNDKVIETCMHECCHFIFFEKCKKLFPDWKWEDFDTPSLLWYLSEIMIDPILNSKDFQNIFKYNFKCYDIFYTIDINGESLIDTIRNIVKNNNIDDAIKMGYQYLKDNEKEFRIKCEGNTDNISN